MSLIRFCGGKAECNRIGPGGLETIAANYPFLVNPAAAGGAGLTKHTLRFGDPLRGRLCAKVLRWLSISKLIFW